MKSFCLVLFVLSFSFVCVAQNEVVPTFHEPARVVVTSELAASAVNMKKFAHRGFKYYFDPLPRNLAEATLWGGYATDMVSTVQNVTHPQWYAGFNADHVVFSKEGVFIEGGWAKFLGNRNALGIVGANFLLDWGIMAIDRRINIKAETGGRKWRTVKILSNGSMLAKGFGHVGIGISNFRLMANQVHSIEASAPGGCWRNTPLPAGVSLSPAEVCN
jgi:hypothetical protein